MSNCDLLIIGSGPAAWSCALTARQRGLNVIVAAAQSDSGWLQRAERIDNYPGMPQVSGRELLRVFRQQAENAGAQVIPALARQVSPLGGSFMTLVGNDVIESQAVVLATGAARPRLLPGEEELLGQGVSWCGTCDGMFYRGREVAVLSAWHGGVEEAVFLSGLASRVDYYTLSPHHQMDEPPYVCCEGRPQALSAAEDGRITLSTDKGGRAYDGVFIFRPAVAPDSLVPGLELEGPFIRVDRRMGTNLPRVYACGDCTGHPLQIAKAAGEGNIAAISAAEDIQNT
ncbi:MAG: NAD(P)/FAD-dependent oxidoreductase [Clostridia bacterium]|nr:NAD(P)/FAD-dependent oxidoreductase [Clostridia bacterium]